MRMSLMIAIATLCVSWCGAAHAEWYKRIDDGIMGTRIVVELWDDNDAHANAAIDAVMVEMRHIDDTMSVYKPTSEVSEVNREAAKHPVKISKELFDLLERAVDFSRITDGAFDITYASVGYMYDFRKHIKPTEQQIEKALPGINYRHLIFDKKNQTIKFSQPGVRIDLGGIAKGYSVDCGIAILQARGIKHALVNAGGDSRIIGDRFGKPWVVGIRHPDDAKRIIAEIPLVNTALSTSGDYEGTSMRMVFAITTSSIPKPATPPARYAAPPSLHRQQHKLMAYRKPPLCWGLRKQWKSTIVYPA